MPILLAEASTSAFDVTKGLELAKNVTTWVLDVIKSEPILAGAFVVGIGVPIAFRVIRGAKGTAKH